MVFIEMSRDEEHGGGTWAFPNCLWAPTEKQGGGRWPFWSKILSVKAGDIILHLRGVRPAAAFVGFSIASKDGFETTQRPPFPKEWCYSKTFYRADLEGFTPFHKRIPLEEILTDRRTVLEGFLAERKHAPADDTNVFLVLQAGRLQCLNGAYLSDLDEALCAALFGDEQIWQGSGASTAVSIETGTQLAAIWARIGQAKFSKAIRNLYGHSCCFPACGVADDRFLVASHIARWSDNEALRGNLGNGLCLCLMHDRAFELGLFTLDEGHRVYVNPKHPSTESPTGFDLWSHHLQPINLGSVAPLADALLEHWIRVDIDPWAETSEGPQAAPTMMASASD